MSIRISADSLRQKAIEAMKLMDADGFAIGGNEGSIAITLTFDRKEVEYDRDSACAGCCGSDVVVKEVIHNELDNSAPTGDVANEARRETELTPRRSWRRWGHTHNGVLVVSGLMGVSMRSGYGRIPITVIEGHIDIAEIEREAYRRGREYGFAHGVASANDIEGVPPVMCGVEPVVVEAWTHDDHGSMKTYPWTHIDNECGRAVSAWEQSGDNCNTPCTVAIWPGVSGGKRVDAGGRDEAR